MKTIHRRSITQNSTQRVEVRSMVRSKAAGGKHGGAQTRAGKARLQREKKGAPFMCMKAWGEGM